MINPNKIKELYDTTHNYTDIAHKLGCSVVYVRKIILDIYGKEYVELRNGNRSQEAGERKKLRYKTCPKYREQHKANMKRYRSDLDESGNKLDYYKT